ncbi:hypothetical protein EPJ67_10545 [Brachyspira aalborgi]|uniref:Uncharacterized protein n=1 Tax=Brachyspira aalborgi TaxID=29522 RepID=A0A5C8FYN7_9SPIR|nr:hypothetical protein [Brachyspira aalborgi]TXJ54699.1 hypothetical protein EPJ67_10545 [Brachyspira aalborgi]
MSYFIELLRSIWNKIKKFFVKVLNFVNNIINFFRNPQRLNKLKQNKNILAISIKDRLENGKYNIVNCLYNKEDDELVDMETDTLGYEAERLDAETEKQFRNADMIVLN